MLEIKLPPPNRYAAYSEGRDGTDTRVSPPSECLDAHHRAGLWAAETATRYLAGYSERYRAGYVVYDGARFICYVRAQRVRE